MLCEICRQTKPDLTWVSGGSGSYLVCPDCALPLRTELHDRLSRFEGRDTAGSLLGELLAAAIHVTRADLGNVQLADENGILRIRAQVGFENEFLDFFSAVQENEAACGTAAASRKTIAVGDVSRSQIFVGTPAMRILTNAGVRAVQSTPMFARSGALMGMVSTHYRRTHVFSYHELDLVGHLAAHAASLLEQLTLLEH